jgi:hypothetical protein
MVINSKFGLRIILLKVLGRLLPTNAQSISPTLRMIFGVDSNVALAEVATEAEVAVFADA